MKTIWWVFFWISVGALLMFDNLPWWGELIATIVTLITAIFVIVQWTVRKPLEASIAAVRSELAGEIKLARTELGGEIRSVRTELGKDIQLVCTDIGGQIELLREGRVSQGEQLVSLTKRVDDLWRVVADEGNGVIPRLVRLEESSEHIEGTLSEIKTNLNRIAPRRLPPNLGAQSDEG